MVRTVNVKGMQIFPYTRSKGIPSQMLTRGRYLGGQKKAKNRVNIVKECPIIHFYSLFILDTNRVKPGISGRTFLQN